MILNSKHHADYQVNRYPFQHALWSDVSLLYLLFLWWFLSLSWVLHDLNKPHSVLFHAFSFSLMWTDWRHKEGNLTLRWDLRRMALTAEVALVVKDPPASAGDTRDTSLIPGLGRSPGGGHGNHSSILAWRIPMDRGAWWATVHRVAKSQTWLKQLSTHMFLKKKNLSLSIFT